MRYRKLDINNGTYEDDEFKTTILGLHQGISYFNHGIDDVDYLNKCFDSFLRSYILRRLYEK